MTVALAMVGWQDGMIGVLSVLGAVVDWGAKAIGALILLIILFVLVLKS
jgi:hypothetical protein